MEIVLFQTILFCISMLFKYKYSLIVKKTFLFLTIQFSQAVLFQLIQFCISTDFCLRTFKCQKQFYIKQFILVQVQFQCQKTIPFQIIQFSISTQFKCKYSLIVYFKLFS